MSEYGPADKLHRLVKQALDNGTALSLEAAKAQFSQYKVLLQIDGGEAKKAEQQIVLLTAIALGVRVFLGGIYVHGDLDCPLKAPLCLGKTLRDAVLRLGAKTDEAMLAMPVIHVGGEQRENESGFHIRTEIAGWRGGIVPANSALAANGGTPMPLAAMLAAALAINEAFLSVNGEMPAAGNRVTGLSLWNPSNSAVWLEDNASEPALCYLPSQLWVIGLGHLGQAYLWGLGLLPYASKNNLHLILQDTDKITPSTQSTSILTDRGMVGRYKTRVMADWAEKRGFSTRVHERLFGTDFKRQNDEPAIALCGIDNALGRQALDQVGFDMVVEAGLGQGHQNFRTMRLHVLPGQRPAQELWAMDISEGAQIDKQPYQKFLKDGVLDQCGVTLLAGKAVGAPFVGAVAASLALSEVLRFLHGGIVHQVIDIDLMDINYRLAVRNKNKFQHLNPGYCLPV